MSPPLATQGPQARKVPTRRNAELGLLLVVTALLTGLSVAIEATMVQKITANAFVLPVLLGGTFLAMHLAVRFLAPYADPVILPAAALLNGLGVIFNHRLDLAFVKRADRINVSALSGFGVKQLAWSFGSILIASLVLLIIRDHQSISRYAYTLGLVGIVLVALPIAFPARNGAKLWITLGSFSIQPGEFAKLALLAFFAYYLVRKREVLSLASRRFMGIDFPRGRDLGPVIAIWLMSLLVLIFEKDLGTSLLYFGVFVMMLYVATERTSWLLIGLALFASGAVLAHTLFTHFQLRVSIWLHPFKDADGQGFQLVQALYGLGSGGLFGTGPGAGTPENTPHAGSDFIIAGFGEETGLFGLTAILLVYLLIVERGLRTALQIRDSFGKLLAGGLSFAIAMQLFVIVGGVSKLIPLTGLTTPFMSYGGSSLLANWMLIALLLRISNAARRPAQTTAPSGSIPPPPPPPGPDSAMTQVVNR